MSELEQIGKLYIDWLQERRKSYAYFRKAMNMLSKEQKDIYGEVITVLDEKPVFNINEFTELMQYRDKVELNEDELYTQLLALADVYIAKELLK